LHKRAPSVRPISHHRCDKRGGADQSPRARKLYLALYLKTCLQAEWGISGTLRQHKALKTHVGRLREALSDALADHLAEILGLDNGQVNEGAEVGDSPEGSVDVKSPSLTMSAGVKHSLSALAQALGEERHFALVVGLRLPTWARF